MELFPFKPNWKNQPVLEWLEWLTDVIPSHNDTEERIPLRVYPRRSLEYEVVNFKDQVAKLDALLWGWQSQEYTVPIWTDPQRLVAQLTLGATSIPADTVGYDFEDGGQAVLFADDESYEVVEINTVGASSLTLSAATTQTWPAGTLLYPARTGRLPDSFKKHMHTSQLAQSVVRVDLDPSDYTAAPGSTLYLGTEVFERMHNWRDGMPNEYTRKTQRLDNGTGLVYVDDHSDLAQITQSYQTALQNRADIADWRGWLYARQGRYEPFWTSMRQWNMEQTASIGASSVNLTIKALDYNNAYNLDAGRQDIALLHKSGQWYYRRIESVATSGDNEILTLDSALGIDADPGDFSYISWLMLSRLAADAVEIAWHTAGLAESAVDFRSVRE